MRPRHRDGTCGRAPPPASRLRDGLARARAVDLLTVITAFAAWDELVTARNRSAATATAAIVDLAVRAVVKDR